MWMVVVPVFFFGVDGSVSFGFETREKCVEMSVMHLGNVLKGMGLNYRIDPDLVCHFEPKREKDG